MTGEELAALRTTLRAFLAQHAPVRQQLTDEPATWKRLTAELGLTGMAIRQESGGAGASFVELTVVLEEAGRSLLRAPLLSTTVAAAALQDAGHTGHLTRLADGSAVATLALDTPVTATGDRLSGALDQVVGGCEADLLLVAASDGLRLVETGSDGVAASQLQVLDPTRPQARVDLVSAPSTLVGGPEAVAHTRHLQHVALAAECVGAAQRCVEMAVEHLRVREQFGRQLGSFQALRHRVADLTVAVEAATSTSWYAAGAAAGRSDDLAVVAPLAKAVASEAFVQAAGESIQLHGGIGFTWEHDAHLYFKRAWTTALMHGDNRSLRRLAFDRSGT